MYAEVNKNKPPPPEVTIYSELGPGGRQGPKPIVRPSIYAEAKNFNPPPAPTAYNQPMKPQPMNNHGNPKLGKQSHRGNGRSSSDFQNNGILDDDEEMV